MENRIKGKAGRPKGSRNKDPNSSTWTKPQLIQALVHLKNRCKVNGNATIELKSLIEIGRVCGLYTQDITAQAKYVQAIQQIFFTSTPSKPVSLKAQDRVLELEQVKAAIQPDSELDVDQDVDVYKLLELDQVSGKKNSFSAGIDGGSPQGDVDMGQYPSPVPDENLTTNDNLTIDENLTINV